MRATCLALLIAVPLASSEPEAPAVRPGDAPEVADPDLKEALPPMRQGAAEPVGGWSSRRQGRSALTLGWDQHAVLGWTYWLAERLAVRASLGGHYREDQGRYSSELAQGLALRWALAGLGGDSLCFVQASTTARQGRSYREVQSDQGDHTRYDTTHRHESRVAAGLDLGLELFWPGKRRVSLEAAAGLRAQWSTQEDSTATASQPATALPATSTHRSERSFELGTYHPVLGAAVNIHF